MTDTIDRLATALADRYTIERELGRGGMATVYLAEDIKHHRRVAIKVLHPELAAALGPERFLREIETTAALRHPHILPLYDSGRTAVSSSAASSSAVSPSAAFLFYVMPYVEGESLRDRLDREKQLPLDEALQIAREVADALSYAHSRGVIHRDIKPENILLESGHAVVADFGIARAMSAAGGEQLTQTGVAVGTPTYMSPEQAAGGAELDGRSDIYSLACVLYEMLAGQPPFTGPTVESVVHQHLAAEPRLITLIRPAVPVSVAGAVQRGLIKNPADRFSLASAFADALAGGAGSGAVTAPTVVSGRAGRWRRWAIALGAIGLVGAGAAGVALLGGDGPPARPGLLVKPFDNLGAPEDEYFADGMTEEVSSRLARISGLAVISRTTALLYKGTSKSLTEIGAELGVHYVLEGTVRTEGGQGEEGRVRVTQQLIRVSDDSRLWSDGYTATLAPGEVFGVQAEIAEHVAAALDVQLLGVERQAVRRVHTTDREAHDAYLQGRFHWSKRTPPDLERAAAYFTTATERDSLFAQAWAGLADAFALLPVYHVTAVPRADAYRRAEDAARRATALDPTLAEAHASLAYARMYGAWDWEGAERGFRRALELEPSYLVAHYWYAELLLALGRNDEAVAHNARAVELAPAAAIAQHLLGWSLVIAGQVDSGLTYERKAIELEPEFAYPHLVLGMVALREGRYDEAERHLERGLLSVPPGVVRAITAARRDSAARPAAVRAVGTWVGTGAGLDDPGWVAQVYGLAGAIDSAVSWYERAFRQRDEYIPYSVWSRPFIPEVIDDPRIVAIRRRAGLPG